jgi:hypothetical protein
MRTLPIHLVLALCLTLFCVPVVYAQSEQTPEKLLDEPFGAPEPEDEPESGEAQEADTGTEESDSSRETDFNEENFRRSMELRDMDVQRSPDLTTGSYSRATGLQALANLPESSQKHLREELREVIVENGPWTPEEAGEMYPYVPSAEAEENPGLANREEAAWGEMVADYHEREAAIHANSAMNQAATASTAGQGEDEQKGQAGPESEASAEALKAQRAEALAKLLESGDGAAGSPSGQTAPPMDAGVSQNAMQLLIERQQLSVQSSAQVARQDQKAQRAQEESSAEQDPEEPDIEFDSEGVIAIKDLENVNLDPDDPGDDQN